MFLDTCAERTRTQCFDPAGRGYGECRSGCAKPSGPATAAYAQSEVASGTGSLQVRAEPSTTAESRPGFRTRTCRGETVCCRSETPTGSRMPVENCYTAAQLDQMETAAANMKDAHPQDAYPLHRTGLQR